MHWNVIVTPRPRRGRRHRLACALARFDRFGANALGDIYLGEIVEVGVRFEARCTTTDRHNTWLASCTSVVPAEAIFPLTPQIVAVEFNNAATPLPAYLLPGQFHVRLERRDSAGTTVDELPRALVPERGMPLGTEFRDPDCVIMNGECAFALLDGATRARYSFAQPR